MILAVCAVLLTAALIYFYRPVREWWLKRLVRQTLALNRICELAGIAEDDLKWLIRTEQRFVTKHGHKHRRLELEFSFNSPTGANAPDSPVGYHAIYGPSGKDVHEPYRVITGRKSATVEEQIASAIRDAKDRGPEPVMSGGSAAFAGPRAGVTAMTHAAPADGHRRSSRRRTGM